MSSFWTKLKIPGVFLPQNGQSKKLLRQSAGCLDVVILKRDSRHFWRFGCKTKSKTRADCPRTECGKPLPVRPKLYNPACGSKCLQLKKCDTEEARKKLSNCREPEKSRERPKSYWEMIFGRSAEDPPDRRVCRRAQRQKQIDRETDPRLCDPRYATTPGDVLIFTEAPRLGIRKSHEPQPRPPPAYKLPKAVLTKNFASQAENVPFTCAAALQFDASSCGSSKCSEAPKPSSLPYEEMKPPGRPRKKAFSCRDGVRAEDVGAPIRGDANSCSNYFNPKRVESAKSFITDCKAPEKNPPKFSPCSGSRQNIPRYSRIEQLKRQTRANQGSGYSELLTSSFSEVSQCQSPDCRSLS